MKISRINMFYPSFGRVKKSAVEKAIELANGDINKLHGVDKIIEEQKDNYMYDIEGLYGDKNYNFVVVKIDSDETQCCETLAKANNLAAGFKIDDKLDKAEKKRKLDKAEKFRIKCQELLNKCNDRLY